MICDKKLVIDSDNLFFWKEKIRLFFSKLKKKPKKVSTFHDSKLFVLSYLAHTSIMKLRRKANQITNKGYLKFLKERYAFAIIFQNMIM